MDEDHRDSYGLLNVETVFGCFIYCLTYVLQVLF